MKVKSKGPMRSNTEPSVHRARTIIVFKNKKVLKGKNISISENLTRYKYDLLKKAVTKYGVDG